MGDRLLSALARIHDEEGVPVGAGLVIGPHHVITCAHVVESACGTDPSQDLASVAVEVTFPAASGGAGSRSSVEADGWHPVDAGSTGDIAVLRLREPLPPRCERPPLLRSPAGGRHPYRVHGFPEGVPGGAPASGEVLGDAGPNGEWRLLSLEGGPYRVEGGFSGAPVWDDECGAVVGIVKALDYATAEDGKPSREAAYMITMETLVAAWPDLERELGWQARLDPEYERHWEPHSRGVKDTHEKGDLFTGRETVLKRLDDWIDDGEEQVALVTGRPGSGKSAVLARVVGNDAVTLALVADRGPLIDGVPQGGMTVPGAAQAIAAWTETDATGATEVVEELRGRGPEGRPLPLIVVDQLDEAADRLGLAQFLGKLAHQRAARVLVGLRTDDGEVGAAMAEALGSGALRLDLDSEFRDDAGALDYARRLLRQILRSNRDEPALERLASQIAARARNSFLLVQILANLFVDAGQIGELTDSDLPPDMVDEIGEIIRNLAAIEGGDPSGVTRRLRHLLTPLAYAGQYGLPIDGLAWAAMASALSSSSYGPDEVVALLASPAKQIIKDTAMPDGTPAARLHHPVLAEGLRHGRHASEDQEKMATELSALCSEAGSEPADPYIALELARHVAQAGSARAWKDLAARTYVLDRLDPAALGLAARPLLLRGGKLPDRILGTIDSQHLGVSEALADRTGLRQLGMARVCQTRSLSEGDAGEIADWWLVSAVLRQHPSHLALGAGSAVNGVVTLVASDGVPLIAAGCEDHGLRLWNVDTGRPHGDPPTVARPIKAVAACETETAAWIVFGDEGGTVTHWDPVSGDRREFQARHAGQLRALCAFAVGERLLVVTAGDDKDALLWLDGKVIARLLGNAPIRALAGRPSATGVEVAAGDEGHRVVLWDLPADLLDGDGDGEVPELRPTRPLRGPTDWLRSVFFFGGEGTRRIAAGGDDGRPRVWSLPEGELSMEPPRGHDGGILATVAYEASHDSYQVASAGADGSIRLWDPAEAAPQGSRLGGHDGPVTSLATHRIDDAVSLVSGGADKTVRIWSLADTPERSPEGLDLARSPLTAVGRCELHGEDAAVAGYADGTARVWDPNTGRPMIPWISAHAGPVRAIAPVVIGGRTAFATGGADGVVRVFDPADGESVGPRLVGHGAPVRAILDGLEIGGGPAFATGSEDATIRFWRPGEREPIAVWRQPGPVRGLAMVTRKDGGAGLAVVGCGRSIHLAMVDGIRERRGDPVEAHADWGMGIRSYLDRYGRTRILSVGDDGAVVAFDPLSGEPPRRIGHHDGPVRALTLVDQAGTRLAASGGEDGAIVLWDLDGNGAVRRAELGLEVHALQALGERLLVGTAEGHLVVEFRPA